MASTTTQETTHPALVARDAAVTGWQTAEAELIQAQEAERSAPKPSAARATARAARLSWGAKKANRKAEIRQAELDLRMDGAEFTPWEEPVKTRVTNSHLLPMTQDEIETKLAKVRALRATLDADNEASVIHDCDVRIKSLLKSAEQRGYRLS